MTKAAWHRIRHKQTGVVQHVASLSGIDIDEFDVAPIRGNREPGEFHTVLENGALEFDSLAARKAAEPAKTIEELGREIDELHARLDALERRGARDI